MYKKKKLFLGLLLVTAIFTAGIIGINDANAIDLTSRIVNVGEKAGFGNETPSLAQTIGTIIKALLSLIGILFMVLIIYAGQLWMTARGNEEQITKAKAIIRGSIIGLLLIFLAYVITTFVVSTTILSSSYDTDYNTPPAAR